jgi:hypothetical protein
MQEQHRSPLQQQAIASIALAAREIVQTPTPCNHMQ